MLKSFLVGTLIFTVLMVSNNASATTEIKDIEKIKVASPEWVDSTNEDGSGLYWEILRKVYNPYGIELDFKIMPYSRAVGNVKSGDYDAWVASYYNEQKGVFYPERKHNLDADKITAVYNVNQFGDDVVSSNELLKNNKVGFMQDFEYKKYIDKDFEKYEIQNREGGIRMVSANRIDVFIGAEYDINNVLDSINAEDKKNLRTNNAVEIPTYMAYADNERGEKLLKVWEEKLPKLLEKGVIAEMFEEWDWNTWHFPSDVPAPDYAKN